MEKAAQPKRRNNESAWEEQLRGVSSDRRTSKEVLRMAGARGFESRHGRMRRRASALKAPIKHPAPSASGCEAIRKFIVEACMAVSDQ